MVSLLKGDNDDPVVLSAILSNQEFILAAQLTSSNTDSRAAVVQLRHTAKINPAVNEDVAFCPFMRCTDSSCNCGKYKFKGTKKRLLSMLTNNIYWFGDKLPR
jgi:hypothetical protein